jgi:hypothetical protein
MQNIDQLGIRKNDDGSFTMCSKNGCCPTIKFFDDGSATISDEGQTVVFTREQIQSLGMTLVANAMGVLPKE